jgi:hypothetical protein
MTVTPAAPTVSASLKSSNLSEAEYDPFMRVLTLRFRKGGVYEYVDVDRSVFEGLRSAESPGQFFLTYVKNQYEFLKKP